MTISAKSHIVDIQVSIVDSIGFLLSQKGNAVFGLFEDVAVDAKFTPLAVGG